MTDDPFEKIRLLTGRKEEATDAWREEVRHLKWVGYSVRAIAKAAGVSHDTVWRCR